MKCKFILFLASFFILCSSCSFNNDNKEPNISNELINPLWEELGPDYTNRSSSWIPGVGRITSIAIDIQNTKHIIVGSDGGGVWKTENKGKSWTPLSDDWINMIVYSLAIDPNDSRVYYWGSYGGKFYKSIDAGDTWASMGEVGTGEVQRILVHPSIPDLIFASSDFDGFYKSKDGGLTWQEIIDDSYPQDLELKPGDSKTIYACGSAVYKSIDSGHSFIKIGHFTEDAKTMAVTPADPEMLYIIEAKKKAFGALYVSSNSGHSFIKRKHDDKNFLGYSLDAELSDYGMAPRTMDISVSTSNANEIHIGGIISFMSLDGGKSFKATSSEEGTEPSVGYCHPDIEFMEFVDDTLYLGTDGGVFYVGNTKNIQENYFTDLSKGLGIRQLYRIGVSQTDPVVINIGTQDNGASVRNENGEWSDWLGADAMEAFVEKSNTDILYGSIQSGRIYRSLDQGLTLDKNITTPENLGGKGSRKTPFLPDPIEDNTIYIGFKKVYKSSDRGDTWEAISQDFGANLNYIKVSASANNIMYASIEDQLYKTEGSKDWIPLSGFSGKIYSIAIHPKNPDIVAIATDSTGKVYTSFDGGNSWTSYLKNLPDFPALSLVWQNSDSNRLYLGMDYGIYYIDNTFSEWQKFSGNLPNVKVYDMEINEADNRIYIATYGRGCWSTALIK